MAVSISNNLDFLLVMLIIFCSIQQGFFKKACGLLRSPRTIKLLPNVQRLARRWVDIRSGVCLAFHRQQTQKREDIPASCNGIWKNIIALGLASRGSGGRTPCRFQIFPISRAPSGTNGRWIGDILATSHVTGVNLNQIKSPTRLGQEPSNLSLRICQSKKN